MLSQITVKGLCNIPVTGGAKKQTKEEKKEEGKEESPYP